ncbi:DUF1289 domain-containing protein [Pelagovum pacificum]|uniref:DUF1289 domain-containing protein n=1 Tax=Pelagovum pacificum TaxID=2588711 RepID=A0A5C5GB99_9RHOB|nr:DUF1289 domain-containing protein [Pelagovum pacificum]QQA41274.1 DUF1289 domain-containing protein [Pelagovum pacificum]TNY31918.1 DUF1289 domain-containing protein [Pelagovum pacificum]
MTDDTADIWARDEPESPCVKICLVHPDSGLCTGCYRTQDEIAAWGAMTSAERRAIMLQLAARKPLVARRRGGRAGRLAPKDER